MSPYREMKVVTVPGERLLPLLWAFLRNELLMIVVISFFSMMAGLPFIEWRYAHIDLNDAGQIIMIVVFIMMAVTMLVPIHYAWKVKYAPLRASTQKVVAADGDPA